MEGTATPAAQRKRSLIVPREHGAWGILLVPMLTGAATGWLSGGGLGAFIPLLVAALSLFWLRTPLESWMGATPVRARTPEEFRLVRNTSIALAAVAVFALAWLFHDGSNGALVEIGAAAVAAFLAQAGLKRIWRKARTAPQMIGAAGLTATAPAAYYVVTLRLDSVAWSLWGANLLFAMNQIQYVQLRIHAARVTSRNEKLASGRWFLIGQVVLVALVALGCARDLLPWLAGAAFLPLLVRGFAWFATQPKPLAVHALGKSELALAIVFGVLLVVGMYFTMPL